MTIVTIASSLTIPAACIIGKGAKARTTAMFEIAPAGMNAETGKTHFVDVMRKAAAGTSDKALLKLIRQEAIVGIATARMPAGEFPRGCTSPDARMNHTRLLFTSFASPDVVNLNAKQQGRRTELQHRVLRNAEQRASVYMGEIGAGSAQTDKANNAKRKTAGSQTQSAPAKGAAPTHSELVAKPAKPADREAAHLFITQQARMLQDYCNKNAKVIATDMGTAITNLTKAVNAANNAEQEHKARAAAKAAEKETATA